MNKPKWGTIAEGSEQERFDSAAHELKNVQHALDQSAIVAITDRAGNIIHVNDRFCKISKYPREELLGKNHRIINSGYHSKDFFTEMWKIISSGKTWEGEIRNRAKDGSFYWVNTVIVPFLDDKEKPYQYVSIRYEITERKIAEEQIRLYAERMERSNRELQDSAEDLRSREESLRSLFHSVSEGIFVTDEAGIIIDANRSAERKFGFAHDEMVGKLVSQFFQDNRGTRKDGASLDLEVSDQAFEYRGRKARLIGVRDITARKLMEAQILMQDRLASIGLLASSLAHEIGNPIGVIRGRAEYNSIRPGDVDGVKKNSDVIIAQIDRVSKLIHSLLNLARGEKMKSLAQTDLKVVSEEVLELMNHEFKRRSIEVRNNLTGTPIVKGEGQSLHQVMLNLLVNSMHAIESAVAAGRSTGHFIEVSARQREGQWDLSVRDSGSGISEANLRNLFKPFFTTKDIGVGTGLGLATSYRIVESWGGKIWAESKEGEGTTFHVCLPMGR